MVARLVIALASSCSGLLVSAVSPSIQFTGDHRRSPGHERRTPTKSSSKLEVTLTNAVRPASIRISPTPTRLYTRRSGIRPHRTLSSIPAVDFMIVSRAALKNARYER